MPRPVQIAPEIFKAYDIRGIVGRNLTPETVELIGHAIGSEAVARKQRRIVIGYDGRLSGPSLAAALSTGIRKSGIDVIDIGRVTTPMVYFSAHHLETSSGVAVTGSHNPPDYNGLKMMLGGETLAGEAVQKLRQRIESNDLAHGSGSYSRKDITRDYFERISGDVKLARPMKVVIDCGNGVPGAFAPALYRELGCEVTELYCEVDGNFPNHHPDPSQPANLKDVQKALAQGKGEIGLAFDGDGDRLGVVTRNGKIIYPDRQLMLFAADVLKRHPGKEIIFDVKTSSYAFSWVQEHGGTPLMWKTGHSFIKQKLAETGAPLAGEMSGHIFFKDRWYGFDDALYAGARLLELLSRESDPSAVLEALPEAVSTPELHIPLAEGENYALMEKLKANARFPGARVNTIDGMRAEYPDGFGLARPSNTTPVIVLRFEANDEAALKRIQGDFRRALLAVKPDAKLPF